MVKYDITLQRTEAGWWWSLNVEQAGRMVLAVDSATPFPTVAGAAARAEKAITEHEAREARIAALDELRERRAVGRLLERA